MAIYGYGTTLYLFVKFVNFALDYSFDSALLICKHCIQIELRSCFLLFLLEQLRCWNC